MSTTQIYAGLVSAGGLVGTRGVWWLSLAVLAVFGPPLIFCDETRLYLPDFLNFSLAAASLIVYALRLLLLPTLEFTQLISGFLVCVGLALAVGYGWQVGWGDVKLLPSLWALNALNGVHVGWFVGCVSLFTLLKAGSCWVWLGPKSRVPLGLPLIIGAVFSLVSSGGL